MAEKNQIEWDGPVPFALDGLGVPYLTYAGGRIGASVNRWGGLHQLAFYGLAPESASPIYFEADAASSYAKLFRFRLCVNGLPYSLELHETQHFPFGYASLFAVPSLEVEVRHHLTLLNDAAVFTLNVVRNPNRLPLSLQWEHHDSTQKAQNGDVVREWSAWNEDAAAPTLTATDRWTDAGWDAELGHTKETPGQVGLAICTAGRREGEAWIALVCEQPPSVHSSLGRRTITSPPFTDGTHAAALLFASDASALRQRMEEVRPALPALARRKEESFLERLKSVPTLAVSAPSDTAVLSSYFAQAPGISETLMVEDKPGAMRAASLHYWVWGWDTVMCAEAYLVSGNAAFVRDALRFYRDAADPASGWAHQFSRDLQTRTPQAPAAQCLYLILLYGYLSYTGDLALVQDVYPFARQILARAAGSLNADGLGTGPALWPDLPVFAGHTGRDCSVFNNSILYQGARAMEALAQLCGDPETAATARQIGRGLEEKFVPVFWDTEKSYFVDSVDSETGEQRKSYPSHALLWQSAFCDDLAHEALPACAEFLRRHHATPRGFLPYPRWDKAFNGDGNQLGQTWPITDVFDTQCLAAAGEQAALTQWMDGIKWFWEQLTVPEAYSVQTINDGGTPDAPGGKQPFSAKSWYMAICQSLAGVSVDLGGVTLGPGLAAPVARARLHYRGGLLQVTAEGDGHYPASLTVDGAPVHGSCKAPHALLSAPGDHVIAYQRTTDLPAHPVILSLHGGTLHTVAILESGTLKAQIAAGHPVWLRFAAPEKPRVVLDGEPVACAYDAALREGKALLPMFDFRPLHLEIIGKNTDAVA